ncbi:MAG: glycosyltransferase family 4 protein, partial [Bryobacteraceae bacterium]
MLFSIDAHAIGQHLTGNETYVRNLLDQFDRLDTDSEFIACVSRRSALGAVPERFQTRLVAENPFVRLGWDLARQIGRDRPNLLHVQYTGPLFCSASVVVSVHDVSFLSNPEYFPKFRARQVRMTVRRTVRKAAKVLTASEFSRRCIVDAYGLDEEKVISIPNGVSPSFRPLARQVAARFVRERFGIIGPYALTIGDLQPRKNHVGLIRAFEEAIRAHPELPHRLLITGKDTWYSPEIRAAAAKSAVAGRIHFTGFADDDDLPALYGGCDLFVFPSFYEGFGLPILEAMACGRAVACSNT